MRQYNPSEVEFIQDRAAERITEALDALGMDYTERRDYVQGPCPVHGGDNHRAWYWAMNSRHWKCMTQHCETDPVTGPSTSVFGLVRGVMARKSGTPWSFAQAVDFVARVLRLDNSRLDPKTAEEIEIDKAIKEYRKRMKGRDTRRGLLLADVLPSLTRDAVYYPGRGLTPDIIAKYHVSVCDDARKPFFHRAFFPILDETGRYVMGWSARSMWPLCEKCRMYHNPKWDYCPAKKDGTLYAKWRHSTSFQAERCLYNIWYARPFIAKTGTAILCEGPGDVWAYEMAGVRTSVAEFGLSMSPFQRQMLQRAGALTLVITLDNDKSGLEARERFLKELNYYFRLFFLTPTKHDVGEMKPEEIDAHIKPVLEQVSRASVLRDGYTVLEEGKEK